MNYIQQAYTGKLGFWKYTIISFLFIGFIVFNHVVIELLNIDQEAYIRREIEKKGKNLVLIDMLIPFVIFLGIQFFWVKYVHRQSITSLTTSRKKIDWSRFFFAFLLWGGITVFFVLLKYFTNREVLEFNFHPNKFLGLLLIGVLMIPIQTSFEEYFFRGYLLQGIGAKFKSRVLPLIITSVIFGLMHIANPEITKLGYITMVYYIGTGFFLGIITLIDEGLELALGFHAANNLIGALLVTADWTAFQTNSIFKDVSEPTIVFDILMPVLVLYPILLFIFSKKYKWKSWRRKLTSSIERPKEIA